MADAGDRSIVVLRGHSDRMGADGPLADASDGAGSDGGCLAQQPSTKLYEYWCDPAVASTKLCFIENYIHL